MAAVVPALVRPIYACLHREAVDPVGDITCTALFTRLGSGMLRIFEDQERVVRWLVTDSVVEGENVTVDFDRP